MLLKGCGAGGSFRGGVVAHMQLGYAPAPSLLPRKGKSGPDEEKEEFKVRKMLCSIVCVPRMVVIQTEKVAMLTRRASANMSEINAELYNVERFVMKSIPLAAADMPSCGDV